MIKNNELLFALYFWMFALIRPIINIFSNYSEPIIISIIGLILMYSFLSNWNSNIRYKIGVFSLFSISISIMLIDFIFRGNIHVFEGIKGIILYGVIPIYLLINCSNYKILIKYLTNLSILIFFISLLNIFIYEIVQDYMDFGYNFLLPMNLIFIASYRNSKNILKLLLLLSSLFLVIIYANKGAVLTSIAFLLFINFSDLFKIKKLNKYIYFFLFFLMLVILAIYSNSIIEILIKFAESRNIYSYTLLTIKHFIDNNNFITLLSGRNIIWELVLNLIENRPLLGYGYGYLQTNYGFYAHNLLLDLMLSYGLFITTIVLYLLIRSIFRIAKIQDENKRLFMLVALFLWIIPLQFSSEFIFNMGFWITLLFPYALLNKLYYH